jgi:hypothetical protein
VEFVERNPEGFPVKCRIYEGFGGEIKIFLHESISLLFIYTVEES